MDLKEIFKKINAEYSIERIAKELDSDLDSHNRGNCPTGHPSESGKCFGLNIEANYAHCFSCGKTWSPIDLYMQIKGIPLMKTVQILGARMGISLKTSEIKTKTVQIPDKIPDHIVKQIMINDLQMKKGMLQDDMNCLKEAWNDANDALTKRIDGAEQAFAVGNIDQGKLEDAYRDVDASFEIIDRYKLVESNEIQKEIKLLNSRIAALLSENKIKPRQ